MNRLEWHARDEVATAAFGAALARALEPGLVVYLRGELGAGKTTLARALIQSLVASARVRSPTYTLIESYDDAIPPIHHLDLYRIVDADEIELLGLRELVDGGAVLLVEWPAHGGSRIPPADLDVELTVEGAGRRIALGAPGERGRAALDRIPIDLGRAGPETPAQ